MQLYGWWLFYADQRMNAQSAHLAVNQKPRPTILSRSFLTPNTCSPIAPNIIGKIKQKKHQGPNLSKNWTEPTKNFPYFIPQRVPPNFWANILSGLKVVPGS